MALEITPFDMAEMLDNEEVVEAYFAQVIEEGDSGEIIRALSHIARARGMTKLAEETGIGRVSLSKALRPEAHPRFDTVLKVTRALGLKLTVAQG
jgi:probable addiction module antidote protein